MTDDHVCAYQRIPYTDLERCACGSKRNVPAERVVSKPPERLAKLRARHYQATSAEALRSIDPASVAGRVYAFLLSHPATTDETEAALHLRHQTCSAAISHMWDEGRVRDSGARRKTRSGRYAIVFEALRPEPVQQALL